MDEWQEAPDQVWNAAVINCKNCIAPGLVQANFIGVCTHYLELSGERQSGIE